MPYLSQSALEHLEQVIIFEGPNTIAAILIESVVGAGVAGFEAVET